ncbi:hypothetical protein FOMPIDRAFT_1018598 [Fomitopsis schrenkii]|uniref:LysM domain-containing protein n=1 Tax=Fomitopsis schrenkii TaxID=2126942 RepID=S8F5C9_FOMSC|nr:hypothetical protein FOMPIDRAFT_1018598 [Fomitopsis schrenkii]
MPALAGDTICLSPNGGWPSVGATSTAQPSPSPTAVAPVPTPTGPGSTPNCGIWYLTKEGDYCNSILSHALEVAPYPPLTSTSATPTPTGNYSTGVVNTNPVPTANYTPIWYTSTFDPVGAAVPTNLANGTRTIECGYYYDVESGDTLDSIASDVGINASVLETWNPQLESSAPVAGTSICVVFPMGNYTLYNATRPSNADPKSIPDCAEWYTVVSGDNCASIEDEFGLTSSQFLQMNPGVGSDCTTLQLGLSYCVLSIYPPSASSGPPGNLAPGSFSNRTSYATVQSGNTCTTLETNGSVSFTDLLRWNPELDVDCENLELGAAYCVAGGGLVRRYKWNLADADDDCSLNDHFGDFHHDLCGCGAHQYCQRKLDEVAAVLATIRSSQAIHAQRSIRTLSDFLRWNPEVPSSCDNLQLAAYCVKGSPACNKVYTVVSGDYCSEIESANGISDAQLRTLNPWIDSACDGCHTYKSAKTYV